MGNTNWSINKIQILSCANLTQSESSLAGITVYL